MSLSDERRAEERRAEPKLTEPLQRQRERREGERRDAPRVRRELSVLDFGGARLEALGYLSLSGASWSSPTPPTGDNVQLRFTLPELLEPITLTCAVTRADAREEGGFEVHALFPELDVKQELALARFLEERARLSHAASGA